MLLYITYAVLVLIVIFMVINASVTSPFGNRKLKLAIGIVIATATVIALSLGGTPSINTTPLQWKKLTISKLSTKKSRLSVGKRQS